jgi:hypothetical protein
MTPKKQTLPKDPIEARIFSFQAVLAEYDTLMFSLLNDMRWQAYRKENPDAVEVMVGIIRERYREIDEELDALLDTYSEMKTRKE